MKASIWLAGSLSTHRRSRVLQSSVAAQSVEDKPRDSGLCLLFGTDFQDAPEQLQRDWYDWSQEPGRTLLLIPPFNTGQCTVPCEWEILNRSGAGIHQDLPLLQALAPEVRYELLGQLQVATNLDGTWNDLSICTAYYRKHPHSGVFAITCLPLWSLVVLDCERELQAWLEKLLSLAGTPVETEAIQTTSFEPRLEHFTVMLHLLTERFSNETAVLTALQSSPIFVMDIKEAHSCLSELQSHWLVEGVQLTEQGHDVIRASPYAAYADALSFHS